MINVTNTFLPSLEDYIGILKRAWDKGWLTNNGELVQELEQNLIRYLGEEKLLFCNNGTIVLQMALKALGVTKEVITTPFSYVATTNAILWQGCRPVFVDINAESLCINEDKIEAAINNNTQAILATHVYGNPCNIDRIQQIANKYSLKVIYDGAHAFGCKLNGKSLLHFGDISTCSFHATKIFHTVEGGCVISHTDQMHQMLKLYRSFGHIGDDYFSEGINGKNSELHAAMGLAVLPKVDYLISERKKLFNVYDSLLSDKLIVHRYHLPNFEYNYSYYPIIFENEDLLLKTKRFLYECGINPRRYFYPSLNLIPQVVNYSSKCPVSEDISKRILCLPMYPGLTSETVEKITAIINSIF